MSEGRKITRLLPSIAAWGVFHLSVSLIAIYKNIDPELLVIPLISSVLMVFLHYIYEKERCFEINKYSQISATISMLFTVAAFGFIYMLSVYQQGVAGAGTLSQWLVYLVNGIVLVQFPSIASGHVYGDSVRAKRELKQASVELKKQNRRVELFASAISHDLRNPLSIAEGYFDIVSKEIQDEDKIERIDSSFERMNRIIEDSLSMARGNVEVRRQELEMTKIANEAWKQVETNGLDLNIEDDFVIEADQSYLKQILENIYRNAFTHAECASLIKIGELEDGFYIEDDGGGVCESLIGTELDYLNEELGFGLAIVTFLVQKHDWEIKGKLSDRGGARFEIITE
jgi:signal transduction histidine kinase